MSLPLNCYQNILETGAVTLATGAENPDFPLWRLSDRDIGLLFKAAEAVTLTVKIDQGAAGNIAVDRLLIPAGHNFSGMTLDIKYSADDVTYTAAVAQWAGAAGLINNSWASLTRRYWKFIITAPGTIPQFAELFLCPTYTWEQIPNGPSGDMDPLWNVENLVTAGGNDRFLQHGAAKAQRTYDIARAGDTQKTSISALNAAWAGSKPFWLCDHEGQWIFGKLRSPITLKDTGAARHSFRFDFVEVLP